MVDNKSKTSHIQNISLMLHTYVKLPSSLRILALLKAQICMISFETFTQIFGIHKALIHVKSVHV